MPVFLFVLAARSSCGVPKKSKDFLGRGETYGVIVSILPAKYFNHGICLDETKRLV